MSMWIKKVATTPLNTIAKVIDSLSGSSTENAPSIHAVNTALSGKANSSHTHTKNQITDFPTFQTTTQEFTATVSLSSLLRVDNFDVDVTNNGWKPLCLLGAYIQTDNRTVNLDWCYLSDLGAVGASVNGQCSIIDDSQSRTATITIKMGYYKFE